MCFFLGCVCGVIVWRAHCEFGRRHLDGGQEGLVLSVGRERWFPTPLHC